MLDGVYVGVGGDEGKVCPRGGAGRPGPCVCVDDLGGIASNEYTSAGSKGDEWR